MTPFVSLIFWNTTLAGLLGSIIFFAQRQRWLKSRPGLSRFMWLVVLLKLIVPPVYSVPIPKFVPDLLSVPQEASSEPMNLEATEAMLTMLAEPDVNTRPWSLSSLLAGVAVFGTLTVFVICWARTRRINRLVRLARPAPDWLGELTERLAEESNAQHHFSVLSLNGCVSPFLWVTRQGPSIVVPAALIDRLDRNDMQLIIRHEIQHFVCRDHWINLFSTTVGALLWWNPVAWWARRELRFAQELCCDASVLATQQGQRRRYAETLLHTVDFLAASEAALPVPTTAFGSCSTFKRRIEMISEKNLSSGMPSMARLLLLPLGALLIATSPVRAHDDEHSDSLADMRGQIRELRAVINDLQSRIVEMTKEDHRNEQKNEHRKESKIIREQMQQLADKAKRNYKDLAEFLEKRDSADGNPDPFEKLMTEDDLNRQQIELIKKRIEEQQLFLEERKHRELEASKLSLELERLKEMAQLVDRDKGATESEKLMLNKKFKAAQRKALLQLMRIRDQGKEHDHDGQKDLDAHQEQRDRDHEKKNHEHWKQKHKKPEFGDLDLKDHEHPDHDHDKD